MLYEENNNGYKSFPFLDNIYCYDYFDLKQTNIIFQSINKSEKIHYFVKKNIFNIMHYHQLTVLKYNIFDKMSLLFNGYEILFNLLIIIQSILVIKIAYLNYLAFTI